MRQAQVGRLQEVRVDGPGEGRDRLDPEEHQAVERGHGESHGGERGGERGGVDDG